ncbi:MAG: hypothetical protein J6M16_07715, partial [Clostridia bacterium]|nr:hypothetical protein [Clostridia bacterium]
HLPLAKILRIYGGENSIWRVTPQYVARHLPLLKFFEFMKLRIAWAVCDAKKRLGKLTEPLSLNITF